MSKLLLSILVMSLMLSIPVVSNSTVMRPVAATVANDKTSSNPGSLKTKDIEKLIGRKLTFKEKVSFFILKRIKPAVSSKSGETAMIFGIAGAALFFIGLFVPYVILGSLAAAIVGVVLGSVAKKADPQDRKAHAATLLGWITLGALAVALLVAAALLSAFSSWN